MEKLVRTTVVSAAVPQLRLPDEVVPNTDKTARLQLLANALEFFARVLGLGIEHALPVKLLAPGVELYDDGSARQL
jgi:hypothetical protein